jgi:hypothetical protein
VKNYFCQLLNLHGVSDVGQTEINIIEPPVSNPSPFGGSNLLLQC